MHAAKLAITHIFPCSINGLLASLKGVSFCAEPFECPPFRVILSGSNIDRGRNYNCPCGWSKMWVIARFTAATDRAFAGDGHSLDFINKACECLDLIGWEHADAVLPGVVGQMMAARGADETTAWRHPVDLVALCDESAAEFSELFGTVRSSDAW